MITAPLLSLFVIPVLYLMWKGRGLDGNPGAADDRPQDLTTQEG
jgi:hypothetical protein